MADETLWIVTAEDIHPSNHEAKGDSSSKNPWSTYQGAREATVQLRQVSVQKLETELSKFLNVIGGLFNRAQEAVNQQTGLKLDEIELSVEITGDGEIKLLGTGIKTGTKGGLTLKFKKV
jgi:hypothetical protein